MIEKFIDITIVYKRRVSLYGAENYILGGNFKRFLKENGFFNDDSILVGIARDNSSEIEPEDWDEFWDNNPEPKTAEEWEKYIDESR